MNFDAIYVFDYPSFFDNFKHGFNIPFDISFNCVCKDYFHFRRDFDEERAKETEEFESARANSSANRKNNIPPESKYVV